MLGTGCVLHQSPGWVGGVHRGVGARGAACCECGEWCLTRIGLPCGRLGDKRGGGVKGSGTAGGCHAGEAVPGVCWKGGVAPAPSMLCLCKGSRIRGHQPNAHQPFGSRPPSPPTSFAMASPPPPPPCNPPPPLQGEEPSRHWWGDDKGGGRLCSVSGTGEGMGGYEGNKKRLCTYNGPLILASLFKISFFPVGKVFQFSEGGRVGGLAWGGVGPPDPPPPPPPAPPADKHIPGPVIAFATAPDSPLPSPSPSTGLGHALGSRDRVSFRLSKGAECLPNGPETPTTVLLSQSGMRLARTGLRAIRRMSRAGAGGSLGAWGSFLVVDPSSSKESPGRVLAPRGTHHHRRAQGVRRCTPAVEPRPLVLLGCTVRCDRAVRKVGCFGGPVSPDCQGDRSNCRVQDCSDSYSVQKLR